MFGYVLPVKPEMKVRDFEAYRAVYCGVCKQLGKNYGVASRFLLNYDMVLLAVLADGVSGEAGECRCEGCFANPLAKRKTLHTTKGLQLASAGLVMATHHKLIDDIQDETGPRRLSYAMAKPFTGRMYRRAEAGFPALADVFARQMGTQRELEAAGCTSIDTACDPTAQMCAALFAEAGQTEPLKRILARLGLFCGQVVYLLDAAEDYPEDLAKGRYNVFQKAGASYDEAVAATKTRCKMAAGEIALCYNLLDIRQYKEVLDNIFFLGLPAGIEAAGIKRTQKRTNHGQIESL